jgi:hypothetical protein
MLVILKKIGFQGRHWGPSGPVPFPTLGLFFYPEDGFIIFLRNDGIDLSRLAASHTLCVNQFFSAIYFIEHLVLKIKFLRYSSYQKFSNIILFSTIAWHLFIQFDRDGSF